MIRSPARLGGHRARTSLLAAILVAAWTAHPAFPATLLVTTPSPVVCVTSQDAVFDYQWGVLRPRSGLFSYSPVGETPLVPAVTAPREAGPGDLLRIAVTEDEDVETISARIIDSKQRVLSRGVGFRPDGAARRDQWAVLIGISSMTEPGEYTVSVTATLGGRNALSLSSLSIHERAFRFERIPLNADLTGLLEEKDPKKTAEAREMARILATPHADAIYEEGKIIVPLPGARRTSGYGDRRKYVYTDNSAEYSVHEGLDLASPEGTPVPACGRGKVIFAGQRIITGNTVVIEHLPGLFSLYFHLSEILVKPGDVVGEGDIIGKVGQTGLATGPHLHWQVVDLGVSVDPDALASGPILDTKASFGDIGKTKDPKGGE